MIGLLYYYGLLHFDPGPSGGFHSHVATPSSLDGLFHGKHQSKNGWRLGVPLFQETPSHHPFFNIVHIKYIKSYKPTILDHFGLPPHGKPHSYPAMSCDVMRCHAMCASLQRSFNCTPLPIFHGLGHRPGSVPSRKRRTQRETSDGTQRKCVKLWEIAMTVFSYMENYWKLREQSWQLTQSHGVWQSCFGLIQFQTS